jgi:hypothetical protein
MQRGFSIEGTLEVSALDLVLGHPNDNFGLDNLPSKRADTAPALRIREAGILRARLNPATRMIAAAPTIHRVRQSPSLPKNP